MDYFAGLDVSLEMTSICIVDADGTVLKEAKVATEPDDLVAFFGRCGIAMKRIGLEAGRRRNGFTVVWLMPGCRWYASRRGTPRRRCRPCRTRPTATMRVGSPTSCAQASSAPCM